jgi:GxxExxY protein
MTPHGNGAHGRRLLHQGLTELILKGFYQVHHELGFGFAEKNYLKAMEIALADVGLKVERQVPIDVHFRGHVIGTFKADLIIESAVMLELKAMRRPHPAFEAQILNYLRATQIEVGFLLYFNPKPLKKRLIFTNDRKLLR